MFFWIPFEFIVFQVNLLDTLCIRPHQCPSINPSIFMNQVVLAISPNKVQEYYSSWLERKSSECARRQLKGNYLDTGYSIKTDSSLADICKVNRRVSNIVLYHPFYFDGVFLTNKLPLITKLIQLHLLLPFYFLILQLSTFLSIDLLP